MSPASSPRVLADVAAHAAQKATDTLLTTTSVLDEGRDLAFLQAAEFMFPASATVFLHAFFTGSGKRVAQNVCDDPHAETFFACYLIECARARTSNVRSSFVDRCARAAMLVDKLIPGGFKYHHTLKLLIDNQRRHYND